jgi:hypothetical protein
MTSVPSSFSVGRNWPAEKRTATGTFGREQTIRSCPLFDPLQTLRLSIDFQLMRAARLAPLFLLAGAARPESAPLTGNDFQQLMQAAVTASSAASQLQPLTATICVKRELQAPIADLRALSGWFQGAGRLRSPSGSAVVDQSIAAAILSKPLFAPQTAMPLLPKKFVMVGKVLPPECVVPHSGGRGPNWRHDESIVVLTFTRPTLAQNYAFIQEYEECAGLCGTTFLRVFRKRAGKWTQVAQVILSVS